MKEQVELRKKSRITRGRVGALGAGVAALAVAFGAGQVNPAKEAYGVDPSTSPAASTVDLGGSATASQSPETVNVQWHHVDAFGIVNPGDFVVGDVQISDTADSQAVALYDTDTHKAADVTNNAATALYVDVEAPGVLQPEWGADVATGMTSDQEAQYLKLQEGAKQADGFNVIDVVKWTGANSTITEGDLTSHYATFNSETGMWEGNPSNPTPSEMPSGSAEPMPSVYEVTPDNDAFLKQVLDMDPNDPSLNLTLDQKLAIEQVKLDYANETIDAALLEKLAACACVPCPTASVTPMPSSTPSATPTTEVCPPMDDHVMGAGDVYKTQNGEKYIVQGDVVVDGKQYYDSNQNTFAILELSGNHTIKAQWGADVQIFCANDATYDTIYQKDKTEDSANGRTLDPHSGTIN